MLVGARACLAEAGQPGRAGRGADRVVLLCGWTTACVVEIGVIALLRSPLAALHPLGGPPVGVRLAVAGAL